jgi:hypothetical protein
VKKIPVTKRDILWLVAFLLVFCVLGRAIVASLKEEDQQRKQLQKTIERYQNLPPEAKAKGYLDQ